MKNPFLLLKRSAKAVFSREFPLGALVVCAMMALLVVALQHRQQRLVPEPAQIQPIAVFPDFASIQEVEVKKQMFFDFLELYIDEQNRRVRQTRERLLAMSGVLQVGGSLSAEEQDDLVAIARRYDLESKEMRDTEIVFELLKRVDIIPKPLALAQAATESAWGTSRFAKEGNNLFGQWCFDDGCGLVPIRRGSDASHEVQAFESIEAAVRAYFMNLNTHYRYDSFRRMRFQMRNQRGRLDALVLAYGLDGYSERGEKYVDELQTIMQQNGLVERYSG
ncbi:MAG: glucosaminidase domain-containing protein [Gammaproteobacteria bacterium]|jgi:Bax protein